MELLVSGASTGIGKACAVHMARLGHSVWAGVRDQKAFDDVVKMNVRGLRPVFLDVCDDSSVQECVSRVTKEAGIIDGLVNNAGVAIGGPVEAVAVADWRRQYEINVFGVVRLTQACLPLLRQSRGRIVNMSSISGRISPPFLSPYSSSKFALEAISDSLRREVGDQGIRVALVEPGPIDTPIWEKSRSEGLGRAAKFAAPILEIYGAALSRFNARLDEVVRTAAPTSVVTLAVEHALTARSPRTRYPVGRGVGMASVLARALPDRLLDRVLR